MMGAPQQTGSVQVGPTDARPAGTPSANATRRLAGAFEDFSRALALLLAAISVGLALAVWLTGDGPAALAERGVGIVGVAFVAGTASLALVALVAAVRLWRDPGDRPWQAAGLQAASGIATLALTFTLLGIGLGIAALAETPIAPDTVDRLIAALTERFSLAFSTTVVGLPLAAGLRGLLVVLAARDRPLAGRSIAHRGWGGAAAARPGGRRAA